MTFFKTQRLYLVGIRDQDSLMCGYVTNYCEVVSSYSCFIYLNKLCPHPGPLVFMNTPSFADDIDLSGKVNGVDLSDLSESAVRVNQNETVRN